MTERTFKWRYKGTRLEARLLALPDPVRTPLTASDLHWDRDVRKVYVIAGANHLRVSWRAWCSFVRRRVRDPSAALPKGITVRRRVRRLTFVDMNTGLVTSRYEPLPAALIKELPRRGRVDWRLELDEIRGRQARRPYLPHLRAYWRERARAYSLSPHEKGWLYLIRNPRNGLIKLGYARRPKRRLEKLRYYTGAPLEIIDTVRGTPQEERLLHHALRPHSIPFKKGLGFEWYRAHRSVLDCFKRLNSFRGAGTGKTSRRRRLA
jgi:hypothetical protein